VADDLDRHGEHDPMLVAALVGDPGGGSADSPARTWIEDCLACSALHADLLALSVSTRAMPTPPRVRDYLLTAADAARLTETATVHAAHDGELVATLVDRTIDPADRRSAEALIEACHDCATLHADLVSLAIATKGMQVPSRPRDYSLTPDDAARLRRGGWRRLVAAFGSSRDSLSRPLAIGLTTLGLVGVLVVGAPSALQVDSPTAGSAAASGQRIEAAEAAGLEPSAAIGGSVESDGGFAAPAPGVVSDLAGEPIELRPGAAAASPVAVAPNRASGAANELDVTPPLDPVTGTGTSKGTAPDGADPSPAAGSTQLSTQPLSGDDGVIVLSGLFLLVGLGLFAIRWGARRLSDN
jgi:hypothetical protein